MRDDSYSFKIYRKCPQNLTQEVKFPVESDQIIERKEMYTSNIIILSDINKWKHKQTKEILLAIGEDVESAWEDFAWVDCQSNWLAYFLA